MSRKIVLAVFFSKVNLRRSSVAREPHAARVSSYTKTHENSPNGPRTYTKCEIRIGEFETDLVKQKSGANFSINKNKKEQLYIFIYIAQFCDLGLKLGHSALYKLRIVM